MAVGARQRGNLDVVVVDFLGSIADKLGAPIDGLLGYNFLREYRVTLDSFSETLYLD